MKNLNYIKYSRVFFFILLISLVSGCGKGFFKKVDSRKVPVNVNERAEKNIQEGRGFKLSSLGNKNGVFDFATSNEMWRASIELLDFTPLSNVDYSGGIIITDWFAEENSTDTSIKITIRFLSNEIRADGMSVSIHKRVCKNSNNCITSKIDSTLSEEIKLAVLKKAAILKEEGLSKDPDYKDPRVKD
mgnify:FL=1|jgi:hypothetical protein